MSKKGVIESIVLILVLGIAAGGMYVIMNSRARPTNTTKPTTNDLSFI